MTSPAPASAQRTSSLTPAEGGVALAGAFALSGAAALVYELLWFRMLGHVFGSTATATATLLAAFLCGLGLGAWVLGVVSDRVVGSLEPVVSDRMAGSLEPSGGARRSERPWPSASSRSRGVLGPWGRLCVLYATIETLIGLYGIASHGLLERGAALYTLAHAAAAGSPGRLLAGRFAVSFLLVALPATLMGGTFPLMVQLLRGSRTRLGPTEGSPAADASGEETNRVGSATGRAYALNTAGAALGTIGLPFVLLPRFGVAASLSLAALSNFAAAALVTGALLRARRRTEHRVRVHSRHLQRDDHVGEGAGRIEDQKPAASTEPETGGHHHGRAAGHTGKLRSTLTQRAAEAPSPVRGLPARAETPSDGDAHPGAGRRLPVTAGPSPLSTFALLAAFFLSSFAALALETVWTRHFGIFFGAKTETFAFVLCAYLVGLFLGGGAYARLAAAGRSPRALLRGGLLLAAAGTALPIPFLDRIAIPQIALLARVGASYASSLAATGLEITLLVIVPAFGLGLVFPAVVDVLARTRGRVGSSIGLAYAVNTLGATLGALAAGFLLVPSFGSQRTLELCALALGAAILLSAPLGPGRAGTGAAKLRRSRLAAHSADRSRRTGAEASTAPAAAGSPAARALRSAGDPSMRDEASFEKPGPLRRFAGLAAIPLALLVLPLLPRWDWRLAHSPYVKDPAGTVTLYREGRFWPLVEGYEVLELKEGTEATVSVCRFRDGSRSLYVNGKADASNILGDVVVQRLLGFIPALFHPSPRRALVIGVGSGTTVGILTRFPLEAIDAAEISPEVGAVARNHFAEINERFFEDPRVALRLDDGRNYLRFQPPASYDLIVSEPSNPWMAGVSGLFTDEFFGEVEEKLRPGGIACQWFHFYSMSVDHVKLVVRTFLRHFPESALFITRDRLATGDIILVGAKGPLRLARLPGDPSLPEPLKTALGQVLNAGNHPVLSGLLAGPREIAQFAGPGPVNTDDRPLLELEAPADLFLQDFPATLAALATVSDSAFVPAGPSSEDAPAAVEIARDGFALPLGPPEGVETRRGVTVLPRLPVGKAAPRWALLGREFEVPDASTGLYRLARRPEYPAEPAEIAEALAGRAVQSSIPTLVNGHPAVAVLARAGEQRTIVVAWNCPVRGATFFVRRRLPASGGPVSGDVASALSARFPCAHNPALR